MKDPRLNEMIAMRLSGNTLQAIGDEFFIGRERVRQIFYRADLDPATRTALMAMNGKCCKRRITQEANSQ